MCIFVAAMKIAFLHPDLGIGGAERLVVDAVIALKNKGHDVKVFTNQYDEKHAFAETKDLDICTIAQWMPRSIFGKMFAFCAYLKMIIAAIYIVMFYQFDVVFSDQVSASQIVLRIFTRSKLVFYCHFPDMLLTKRDGNLKSFYRYFLDSFEEYTTSLADVICVNSKFTASVVKDTFKSLKDRELTVIYPSLNTEFFDNVDACELNILNQRKFIFTSLNRFERKKNVHLAILAFGELVNKLSRETFSKCQLVIAGGYDKNNVENIEYYNECVDIAAKNNIDSTQIVFLKSPSDEIKVNLLRNSRAILYTPDREHFGIVPVEAMYLGTPVIAINSGGPMETVNDGVTGYLVEQNSDSFAEKMAVLVNDDEKWKQMSEEGPKRVKQLFDFHVFSSRLDDIVKS